jgi:[citrate (pro-3S)-lyase] ligase
MSYQLLQGSGKQGRGNPVNFIFGSPLAGTELERTRAFLSALGLRWDEGIESTINIEEEGVLAATGSRQRNVFKCIGVSPKFRGEGLAAALLSELTKDAFGAGYGHLFIFTKPANTRIFRELGYYEIASTADAVLLENQREGIAGYVRKLRAEGLSPAGRERTGCIIANCNPFTRGHLYLAEQGAAGCDLLYFFVLSEAGGRFSPADRLNLVREGTAHLPNIRVVSTGDYLISFATFPDYFIRSGAATKTITGDLDLAIFLRHFAPLLNIGKRFVGTEPFSPLTRAYNERMKTLLPAQGIEVIEIKRYEVDGRGVSASLVRELLDAGRLPDIRPLVPDITYRYLEKEYARAAERV